MPIKFPIPSLKNHYSVSLLISLLLLLTIHYQKDSTLTDFFTQDKLYQQNQAYLYDVERRSVGNFVRLASIHSTLSAMQSSQVGISFIIETQITIGKELDELTQLTASGARYSSYAVAAGIALQNILLFSRDIAPLILNLFLLMVCIYSISGILGWKCVLIKSIRMGRATLQFLLLFHLVIPYSVHLSAYLTHSISNEHQVESSRYFEQVHEEYIGHTTSKNVKKRAHTLVGRVESVLKKIEHKVESFLINIIKYFVSELITTIIIPIGLLYSLFRLMRRLTDKYLLHPQEPVET